MKNNPVVGNGFYKADSAASARRVPKQGRLEEEDVLFLKIKKSNPNATTSSEFEKLGSCMLSLSVAQKGLDAILKFQNADTHQIRKIIKENRIKGVHIVRAKKHTDLPLIHSTQEKDLTVCCIRCDTYVKQDLADALVGFGAFKVFFTDDDYNILSLFATERIAYINDIVIKRLYPKFRTSIRDFTVYATLEVMRNKEAPKVGGIASDIDTLIECGKNENKYWETLLDIIRALLHGPDTNKNLSTRVKKSYEHTKRCVGILERKGAIVAVGKEGKAGLYGLSKKKFPHILGYLQ